MFNIIPLIIILFCLGVIVYIVVRKFSALANLDVDSIPAAREARVKEQIISNRLKRNMAKVYKQAGKAVVPVAQGLAVLGKGLYEKLKEHQEKRRQEESMPVQGEDEGDLLAKKFYELEELLKAENWPEAEKKCIDIIGQEPTNIRAFQTLGQIYREKKEYPEAIQTLEHALRLLEKDFKELSSEEEARQLNVKISQIYHDLAGTARSGGDYPTALKYAEAQLKIEPNNPKMLDTKLQISIMTKDKIKALDALENLGRVNPENAKLPEYKEQVKEL